MPYATRDGVRLYYTDEGKGDPPLLFVHGWCCDHTYWRKQVPLFRRRHRVVAVDLRGHGRSSKPKQDYTMAAFARDLEWLIVQLDLRRPVVIGHSMGGVIALHLAGRNRRPLSSVVIVDSVLFPKFDRRERALLPQIFAGLEGPAYQDVARQVIDDFLFVPASPPRLHRQVREAMVRAPQHVMSSCFRNLWIDNTAAARAVKVPALAIVAGQRNIAELAAAKRAVPGVQLGVTVGAGHFIQLEAPQQLNAMLQTFIAQLGG